MSEIPPPYAQYPRNEPLYGTSAQLQSLMDGYYGYSRLFLIQIGLALVWIAGIFLAKDNGGIVYLAGIPILILVIGFLSYPLNKKIGYGANWSTTQIVLASLMMAFTVVCYGILGYIIMQTIAANHIKRYGVRSGCLGLRKKAIRERISDLQAQESGAVAAPGPDTYR